MFFHFPQSLSVFTFKALIRRIKLSDNTSSFTLLSAEFKLSEGVRLVLYICLWLASDGSLKSLESASDKKSIESSDERDSILYTNTLYGYKV